MEVLEASNELRLDLEAADELWVIRQLGLDHLDGHIALDRGLEGAINRPERAFAEAIPQLVPAQCHGSAASVL